MSVFNTKFYSELKDNFLREYGRIGSEVGNYFELDLVGSYRNCIGSN